MQWLYIMQLKQRRYFENLYEEFENTKRVIRIRKLKDR